jgi:hypothetical protein
MIARQKSVLHKVMSTQMSTMRLGDYMYISFRRFSTLAGNKPHYL